MLWSDEFDTFDFGERHPVRVSRFREVYDALWLHGFLDDGCATTVRPEPLSEALLRRVHSEEYLSRIREISRTGVGDVAIDTPGFRGMYEHSRTVCGATVTGVRLVHEGQFDHFFSPTGGFHHAHYHGGGGFCVFNDVAAAVYELKSLGYERVLIADFDAHHGNGTQRYFYSDPEVMQISFHEDPDFLYPHEGRIEEIGGGAGRGFNINMCLPIDTGDVAYRYAFDELVPPLVEFFRPQFVILIPGFDAHYRDPLVQLTLTTRTIRHIAEYFHHTAHRWGRGRMGVVAGGAYDRAAFRWGACVVMSVLTGRAFEPPVEEPPFDDDEETWETTRDNVEAVKTLVFGALGI